MQQKRVIITGCPRSGTSALSMLMSHATNAFICNEMGLYLPGPKEFNRKIRTLSSMWSKGREEQPPFGVQTRGMKISGLTPSDIIEYQRNESYGDLEFFGDKHPHYCIHKPLLRHLRKNYAHFYYLICYRDPLDTIASFIRKSRAKDPQPGFWFCNSIHEATNKWIQTIRNWTQELYHHVPNIKIIKYEDYCYDGEKLIGELSDFLGGKLDTLNTDTLGTFRSPAGSEIYYPVNVGAHKDIFGPKQIRTIRKRTSGLHERVMKMIHGGS